VAPEIEIEGRSADDVIRGVLERVEVPVCVRRRHGLLVKQEA